MTYDEFERFAEACFGPDGRAFRAAARAETDWPVRRAALLAASEIDACERRYEPKPRCVLEDWLVEIGRDDRGAAIARLVHIADHHPQHELQLRALHGLLHAGPEGVDAAAGPPGGRADGPGLVIRARAAIVRGDGPEVARAASEAWKDAVLHALQLGMKGTSGTAPQVPSASLLAPGGAWLDFVIDAYFDPALAERAEAVLWGLPKEQWKPLVLARRRAAKKAAPKTTAAKKPSARALRALDDELRDIRTALEEIVATLEREGYAFVRAPLEPPPKAFATRLRKLERRIGRVPLALARFWALVGAVDLRGNHPAWASKTWVASGADAHWYADPLVVVGLDAALADAEDGDFDAKEAPAALRYALDLAGDDVTKANFSGGIVSVQTPSDAIDPPLYGREGTFLQMLRESIAWRGFPGFARIEGAPITRREPTTR